MSLNDRLGGGAPVATVAALRSLGQDHLVAHLDSFADTVERFTEMEVAAVTSRGHPDQVA